MEQREGTRYQEANTLVLVSNLCSVRRSLGLEDHPLQRGGQPRLMGKNARSPRGRQARSWGWATMFASSKSCQLGARGVRISKPRARITFAKKKKKKDKQENPAKDTFLHFLSTPNKPNNLGHGPSCGAQKQTGVGRPSPLTAASHGARS